MTETKIFENRQVDEARWPDPVTIRIRAAVTDEIKAEFSLGPFDTPIRFARRRLESADLHLRIHNGPSRDLFKGLLQDSKALPHFQRAHHQAIIGIAVVAQRYAKLKAGIESIAIHFAQVVVHAAGPQHRSGDAGIDRQLGGEPAHALRARDQDLALDQQLLELIEEFWKGLDNFFRALKPLRARVHPATPKSHVVTHHA